MPHPAPKDRRAVSTDGNISILYSGVITSHDRGGGVYDIEIGGPWVNGGNVTGSILLSSNSVVLAENKAKKEGVDIDDFSVSESMDYVYKFQLNNGFFYRVSEFILDLNELNSELAGDFIKILCELLFSITSEIYAFEKNSGLPLKDRYPVEIDFAPYVVGSQEKSPSAEFRETYFKTFHFIRGA